MYTGLGEKRQLKNEEDEVVCSVEIKKAIDHESIQIQMHRASPDSSQMDLT